MQLLFLDDDQKWLTPHKYHKIPSCNLLKLYNALETIVLPVVLCHRSENVFEKKLEIFPVLRCFFRFSMYYETGNISRKERLNEPKENNH